MTWSLSASGHHSTSDWRADEHELLRRLVEAVEAVEADGGATVTSTFSFAGNHVYAASVGEAREKLAAYDAEDGGEDDAAASEVDTP